MHQRQNSRGRSNVLKVILLGDGGVGKSCLMNRFVNNRFDDQSQHTIGVEFLNKDIDLGKETYTLQIWDTAGQERFKSLRTPFYRGSDMCMLTFSLDNKTSFENVDTWKKEFTYYADVKADFPFLIVGNKNDLEPEVTSADTEAWCQENGHIPYVETSAKDATNVEEAFLLCLKRWINGDNRENTSMISPDTVQLENVNNESKSKRQCSSCST